MQMKTVDLFDLIEENEINMYAFNDVNVAKICKMTMDRINTKPIPIRHFKRGIRMVVLAAVIISLLLGTSVFAYVGFVKYENPAALLNSVFGDTSFNSNCGGPSLQVTPEKDVEIILPTIERVPVDETASQEVDPFIMNVNQSVSYDGYTLTVLAHQYDSSCESGFIYYTLVNPDGISGYAVCEDNNNELWWTEGNLVNDNLWGRNYLIKDESSSTKLAVAFHYQLPVSYDKTDLWIGFDENNAVAIEFNDGGGMVNKVSANGDIILSPTGMRMCLDNMEFLGVVDTNGMYIPPRDDNQITYLSLVYRDGSKFVVWQDADGKVIQNYISASVTSVFPTYMSYSFNRLISINEIEAVIVNGVRYPVYEAGKQPDVLTDDGRIGIGGACRFVEAAVSEEEEAQNKYGAIDNGILKHRILGARVITNAKDIPEEGRFFEDNLVCVYTIKGDEISYRYPAFIQEDGSFAVGVRMLLIDVEITSVGAENWTADTWPRGLYENPYVFRIDGDYWLQESRIEDGSARRYWTPDFFSDMDETEEHPFAYRILPGQTRRFTIGFLVGGHMDGTIVPLKSLFIRVPYGPVGDDEETRYMEQLFPIE